jgi:uncharacterized protein YgbK (DUF1537 family)
MLVRVDDNKREEDAKEALEEALRALDELKKKKPLTPEQFEDLNRRST